MKSQIDKLYGLWSAGVVLPTTLLSTTLFASAAIAAGLKHPQVSTLSANTWAKSLLAANFTTVSVEGAEHCSSATSYVVMSNHQSYFDTLALLGHLPLPLRFVMKKELGRIPLFGTAVRRWGGILVDRSDRGQAIEELQKGIVPLVDNKLSLLVFPEGTRSKDGQLGPFKKGGFMTAIQAGLPVLPVVLLGSAQCLPAKGFRLRPGHIVLRVGQPIDVSKYGVEQRDRLMADVRASMLGLLGDQAGTL